MSHLDLQQNKGRAKDDIVGTISRYIKLTKKGDEFVACCPFHDEDTPSFTVTPATGYYYCFGCGEGGDAIDFVSKHEGIGFAEAVNHIVGNHTGETSPVKRQSIKQPKAMDAWEQIVPVPAEAPSPNFTFNRMTATRTWMYRDANGDRIGYVCRFDKPEGGKEVVPLTYWVNRETGEMKWRYASFSKPRPMYGLDKLAVKPDAQVLIVEGEKAADAAQKLFGDKLVVVSWPGGGKAVKFVDWSPLKGRRVGLWPDADQKVYPDRHEKAGKLMPFIEQPGTVAMMDVGAALQEVAASLKFIMPPEGVQDGWDLADELPDGFNLMAHAKSAAKTYDEFLNEYSPAPNAEPAPELVGTPEPEQEPVNQTPVEEQPADVANDNASNFPYIPPQDRKFTPDPSMGKLKASSRAGFLTHYYGAAYVSPDEARNIHVFDGAIWVLNTSEELEFDAAAMLKASGVDFDPNEVTNIIKVMRQGNRRMGLPPENIISFKNGVFDFDQNVFRSASPYDWQTTQNGIVWRDAEDGESLAVHAPNFHKWLSHAKYGSDSREEALLAALYMVLTCRYNWELAISLTGEGGAGKSVMQRICTMLSGEHNMAAIDIDGICGDFGLEHLLAKRLLIASEVAAKWPKKAIRIIKAMTGGDFVMVNRKGEKVVSALVRAIMIFTGNEAFDFGSVDSGLQRRIVHFGFTQKVPDEMKDDKLTDKIADELPVVIRHLLQRFANPEVAKKALLRQRDGSEASAVKYEGNPLERFLSSLEIDHGAELTARSGMQWNDTGRNGTGAIRFERQFVYHAYLSFCDSEALKPSMDMAGIRRAVKYRFGDELKTGKGSQNRTLVNLRVRDDAEYLPQSEDRDNVVDLPRMPSRNA
ncbi:TPA: CHC2 zinc finger domain-containing protein [Klebsiella pneumoniae]